MTEKDKKWQERVDKVLEKDIAATQEELARAVAVRKEQLEEPDGIIAQ